MRCPEQRVPAFLVELSHIRAAYKKVENALKVEQKSYGIVVPDIDELICRRSL